jgi:hypothetical protein
MAYQIDRYNNTLLTTVEDGTVDQTTDLKFIGKNYAGYGEIQNENFLFLLENFSGANQPARPISGQVWFDSGNSKLKFYDGTQWRTTGGAEIGADEPAGLAEGDFWWDNANDQLYVYNGTAFILIGPQNAGEGVTQMQSREVLDDGGATRSIITGTINDNVVMIISSSTFTLAASETALKNLDAFNVITKGITLINSSSGVTSDAHRFQGTASNSDKLEGFSADQFVRTTNPNFNTVVTFPDAGVQIGDSQDLRIKVENGTEGVISNITGLNSKIKFKATNGTGQETHVATFTSAGFNPATNNTFDLGSASLVWNDVYATNFVGIASKAATLNDGSGNYRTASVATSNNTVAVRDATGNLSATLFQGTATQARYADLAEKYSTSEELVPGTVVCVCKHDDHEVEAANRGCIAIGVVSTDPAVMMNSDAEGQYIGLKGRLPVRVIGPVAKGDAVYVDDNGCASTAINGGSVVGIALESNFDEGEKLVECVLKV